MQIQHLFDLEIRKVQITAFEVSVFLSCGHVI